MSSPNSPAPPKASIVKYKAALRKAVRMNQREPDIDFLNITAMMDMMTIILVFLLKSMTTSNAAPSQGQDLTLPKSVMVGQPKEDGVAIIVSKTQILVGNDANTAIPLPSREALAQSGVDARYKRGGPNDLYITRLGEALRYFRETDLKVRRQKGLDDKSEAVIIADGSTPYRLLLEVLYTLGQSEFGKFHMLVLSGSGGPTLARLVARGRARPAKRPPARTRAPQPYETRTAGARPRRGVEKWQRAPHPSRRREGPRASPAEGPRGPRPERPTSPGRRGRTCPRRRLALKHAPVAS